jgi:glycerol-3-phosphate acyltransferase PlsY
LLGDVFKGTAAVALVYLYYGREYDYFARELALPAALGAFLGHLFPVWVGFKGGKGVATYLGILVALAWPAAIAFIVIWLVIAALTRYSSLSALAASAAAPFSVWMLGEPSAAKLFLVLTVLLWIMHRDNIARLVNGTEGKIGQSPAL